MWSGRTHRSAASFLLRDAYPATTTLMEKSVNSECGNWDRFSRNLTSGLASLRSPLLRLRSSLHVFDLTRRCFYSELTRGESAAPFRFFWPGDEVSLRSAPQTIITSPPSSPPFGFGHARRDEAMLRGGN